ncbi:MAG: hypothetical protein ACRDUA_09310 [Micromonosporaceae bacterium]
MGAAGEVRGLVEVPGPCLVVGPRESFLLASALDLLVGLLERRDGVRLPPAVLACHVQLRNLGALYERGAELGADVGVSASVRAEGDRSWSGRDLVDSCGAAAIIGCGVPNVRDLRRRGRLDGHWRGGRWWFVRAEVLELRDARQVSTGR